MIKVVLPYHLRNLARIDTDIELGVDPPVTIERILSAIEERYPMLKGTIRDHTTKARRPFIRFFAAGEDWSNESNDSELPPSVQAGQDPFMVVGAIAGG